MKLLLFLMSSDRVLNETFVNLLLFSLSCNMCLNETYVNLLLRMSFDRCLKEMCCDSVGPKEACCECFVTFNVNWPMKK